MNAVTRVLRWSLIGAALGAALVEAIYLAQNGKEVFGPHDADEVQAWARFGAVMVGLGGAGAGFLVGGLYGLFRATRGGVGGQSGKAGNALASQGSP